VLTLEGLPQPWDGGLRLARSARDAVAAMRTQAQEAGAAALVLVLEAPYGSEELAALARVAEAPRRELGGADEADRPLATFFMSRPAAARAFRMAGLDAAALLGDTALARPIPLSGLAFQLAAPSRVLDDSRPPNVVGVLRGSDPELRDTYVVLSAHMDHVGVGRPDATGDSIYNGADDDASGTSVLLEVAQAMATLERPPRRSVLFLAVSGEEKGLLGSRWFADHPTVPLDAMVANINIDMVGRNSPDSIVVIGQDYSSLGPMLRQVAEHHDDELGLTVAEDLWPEERFFFRSDHFNFARKEIPALFFFSGTHEDYHAPSDEVDAIDTAKTARVARLVFYLTYQVAQDTDVPKWDRRGLEEVRRLTRP
jgi:Zn-dependent M28 family amino/carboxypeptidase